MTPADILAIADKHGAYPDCTPTLRGEEAIVAFAREIQARRVDWQVPILPNEAGETVCHVRWMVETPKGWLGAWDREAFDSYLLGDLNNV